MVIAGMGGETIAQILEEAPWVRTRKVPLVLQPMSSLPELRQRLRGRIPISGGAAGPGGDTLYVVMRAEAGRSPHDARPAVGRSAEPGPLLGGLSPGPAGEAGPGAGWPPGRDGRAEDRRRELAALRRELLEMREEWDAWQR